MGKAFDAGVIFAHGIQGKSSQSDFLTRALPSDVAVCNILLPGHGKAVREFCKSGAGAGIITLQAMRRTASRKSSFENDRKGMNATMYEKKLVCDFIDAHKDEFIKDISELVAIKSVKGEPSAGKPFGEGSAAAIAKACEMFARYGFSFENLDNYAAYADLSDSPAALDILGHLDVVGEGDGWETDPYTATVKEDGCIYGRGTDDDKGPVIAALYAMRAVKECGIKLTKNARLIVGGDEESGSELDLEHYYRRFSPAPATFSPDASFPIFNTEKGSYKPTFTKKFKKCASLPRVTSLEGGFKLNVVPPKAEAVIAGVSRDEAEKLAREAAKKLGVTVSVEDVRGGARIAVSGRSAHASTPEEGVNALTALLSMIAEFPLALCDSTDAIRALASLFPHGDNGGKALGIAQSDEISGDLTLAFSMLSMDESGASGKFDARIPVCANAENCRVPCEKALNAAGFDVSGELGKPHHTPADSDFVKTLAAVYEEYTGKKGECLSMGGGTYVHKIEGGVAFGASMPGFVSNLHGANERARLEDLFTASKIFASVIISMCK